MDFWCLNLTVVAWFKRSLPAPPPSFFPFHRMGDSFLFCISFLLVSFDCQHWTVVDISSGLYPTESLRARQTLGADVSPQPVGLRRNTWTATIPESNEIPKTRGVDFNYFYHISVRLFQSNDGPIGVDLIEYGLIGSNVHLLILVVLF